MAISFATRVLAIASGNGVPHLVLSLSLHFRNVSHLKSICCSSPPPPSLPVALDAVASEGPVRLEENRVLDAGVVHRAAL